MVTRTFLIDVSGVINNFVQLAVVFNSKDVQTSDNLQPSVNQ